MNDLTGLVDTITSKPAKTILLGSALLGVIAALSGVSNVIDKYIFDYRLGFKSNLDTSVLVKRGAILGAVFGAPFAYLSAAGVVYGEPMKGLGIAQSGRFRVLNNENRVADYRAGRMFQPLTAPDDYIWAENPSGENYLIFDPKFKL